MNGHVAAATSVTIGDDVLMAWGVTIVDHDSHSLAFSKRADDVAMWMRGEKDWTHVPTKPVVVGNKAWIGLHAMILTGVTIGEAESSRRLRRRSAQRRRARAVRCCSRDDRDRLGL